jgi:hypothetical protein
MYTFSLPLLLLVLSSTVNVAQSELRGTASTSASASRSVWDKEKHDKKMKEAKSQEDTQAVTNNCVDEPNWYWDEDKQLTCDSVSVGFCESLKDHWYQGKNVYSACCACNGGISSSSSSSTNNDYTNGSTHSTTTSSPSSSGSGFSTSTTSKDQCIDEPNWFINEGVKCSAITSYQLCAALESNWYDGKNVYSACCVCGGGIHEAKDDTRPNTNSNSNSNSSHSTQQSNKNSFSSKNQKSNEETNNNNSHSNHDSSSNHNNNSSSKHNHDSSGSSNHDSNSSHNNNSSHDNNSSSHDSSNNSSGSSNSSHNNSNNSNQVCIDDKNFETVDSNDGTWSGKTCNNVNDNPEVWCDFLFEYSNNQGHSVKDACCACGGGSYDAIGDGDITGNDSNNNDTDDNTDENADENTDENMDENTDENADENTDENMDENTDENGDENTDENTDEDTDANFDTEDNDNSPEDSTDTSASNSGDTGEHADAKIPATTVTPATQSPTIDMDFMEKEKIIAEEEEQEIMNIIENTTAEVIAGIFAFLSIAFMLFTAAQLLENPNGLCASCCRLTLKTVRLFVKFFCCIPLSFLCGTKYDEYTPSDPLDKSTFLEAEEYTKDLEPIT